MPRSLNFGAFFMTSLTQYALIVAGGQGSRMKSSLPKQFMTLLETPVLMHTIKRFYDYSHLANILLVLPEKELDNWEKLKESYGFKIPHRVICGGDTRFQSVKNGLNSITEPEALIAIHDGVRPLVSAEVIAHSFKIAEEYGNAIASVPLKDSIRKVIENDNFAEDRSKFRLIQTPQTFRLSLIKKAFEQQEQTSFTDDASVLENTGERIILIDGSYDNIKITTPEDLIVAEALLRNFRD